MNIISPIFDSADDNGIRRDSFQKSSDSFSADASNISRPPPAVTLPKSSAGTYENPEYLT